MLICISLVIYDVDHLLMSLFGIYMSFLLMCLLRSLTHFFHQIVFLLSFKITSVFQITVLYNVCLLQTISPSLWMVFLLSTVFLREQK